MGISAEADAQQARKRMHGVIHAAARSPAEEVKKLGENALKLVFMPDPFSCVGGPRRRNVYARVRRSFARPYSETSCASVSPAMLIQSALACRPRLRVGTQNQRAAGLPTPPKSATKADNLSGRREEKWFCPFALSEAHRTAEMRAESEDMAGALRNARRRVDRPPSRRWTSNCHSQRVNRLLLLLGVHRVVADARAVLL